MVEFDDFFHCKLYDKESLLKWELPEKIKENIGFNEYGYFFLATPREESHEGHKHVHLSIFPTKYDVINLLEVETLKLNPKTLQKILESVKEHKFDIITSTGTCKDQNKCFFGVFFSKPLESNTEDLISVIKKIEDVHNVTISNYTCQGYCEE